ncbi:hypothetical protein [Thiolapillus sp.]
MTRYALLAMLLYSLPTIGYEHEYDVLGGHYRAMPLELDCVSCQVKVSYRIKEVHNNLQWAPSFGLVLYPEDKTIYFKVGESYTYSELVPFTMEFRFCIHLDAGNGQERQCDFLGSSIDEDMSFVVSWGENNLIRVEAEGLGEIFAYQLWFTPKKADFMVSGLGMDFTVKVQDDGRSETDR